MPECRCYLEGRAMPCYPGNIIMVHVGGIFSSGFLLVMVRDSPLRDGPQACNWTRTRE